MVSSKKYRKRFRCIREYAAYELFDLVNEFDKTYYKDIHERGIISADLLLV